MSIEFSKLRASEFCSALNYNVAKPSILKKFWLYYSREGCYHFIVERAYCRKCRSVSLFVDLQRNWDIGFYVLSR